MENIVKNLLRLGITSFYPLCILFCFFLIISKPDFKKVIKTHYKHIILNTLLIAGIGAVVIAVFFHFENMIYSYDYAGHWVRALEMRELFFENPHKILPTLYQSMNHSDYSYLPAVFLLPMMIFKTGYGYFCLSNFILFLMPVVVLLEILYYRYFDRYSYLPVLIFLFFYPLYFGIFYGEVDASGLFFITFSIILLFLEDIDNLRWQDAFAINLSSFLLLFLRRYYLYYIFAMYVLFLFRTLYFIYQRRDRWKLYLSKAIFTGIVTLFVLLIFFMPYILNVLGNNFSEAYAVYDRDNKIVAFINYFSPIMVIIAGSGLFFSIRKKEYTSFYLLTMIIIICAIFWQTQAFEYHHYNLIIIPFLFLFMWGFMPLIQKGNLRKIILTTILLIQSFNIYLNYIPRNFSLITTLRKQPEAFWGTDAFKELSSYLSTLTQGEGQSIFIASGSAIFNYDLLQNANLPDFSSKPVFDTITFDLRDGFPKDLRYISYVLITDPIQYINKDYQHIYDVITNAILHEEIVQEIYTPIYSAKIDTINVTVYQRTGEFTPEIKQYFYDEMIKIYPDKQEFFQYILD